MGEGFAKALTRFQSPCLIRWPALHFRSAPNLWKLRFSSGSLIRIAILSNKKVLGLGDCSKTEIIDRVIWLAVEATFIPL